MTSPPPVFQSTAQRVIEHAAAGREDTEAIAGAAEQVFQALHEHLAKLIGVIGFRTLLARSLKLARPGLPALAWIEVKPEGTIAGLVEALAGRSPTEALAAPATLLAQFLDLLAAFVGEDLALHLVNEATRSGRQPVGGRGPGEEGSIDEGRSEHR
jgi:hypothetical protein